jgi:hypothetical protein
MRDQLKKIRVGAALQRRFNQKESENKDGPNKFLDFNDEANLVKWTAETQALRDIQRPFLVHEKLKYRAIDVTNV